MLPLGKGKKKAVLFRVEFEYHAPVLELSLSTTIPGTQTQLMTKPTLYSTQLIVIGEGPDLNLYNSAGSPQSLAQCPALAHLNLYSTRDGGELAELALGTVAASFPTPSSPIPLLQRLR